MKLTASLESLFTWARERFFGIKKKTTTQLFDTFGGDGVPTQTMESFGGKNPEDWKDKTPQNFSGFLDIITKEFADKGLSRQKHVDNKKQLLDRVSSGGMLDVHEKEWLWASLSFYLKESKGRDLASAENKDSALTQMIGNPTEWAQLLLGKEDREKFSQSTEKGYPLLVEFLKKGDYRIADAMPVLNEALQSFVTTQSTENPSLAQVA